MKMTTLCLQPDVYMIMKDLLGNNWHFIYMFKASFAGLSPCLQGQGIKVYDRCLFILGKHGRIFSVLLNLTCNHIYHRHIFKKNYIYLYAPFTLDECRAWFHSYGPGRAVRNREQAENSKWKYMPSPQIEPATSCFSSWRLRPLGHADSWRAEI